MTLNLLINLEIKLINSIIGLRFLSQLACLFITYDGRIDDRNVDK